MGAVAIFEDTMTKAERRRLLAAIDRYKNAASAINYIKAKGMDVNKEVLREYKKAKSAMMAIIDAMAGIVHEEER